MRRPQTEPDAFDGSERRIYDDHAPAMHRFLRDMLRSDSDAADALQETFLRAYRELPRLRNANRLKPWLFGIARNVCMEELRARRRLGAARPKIVPRDLDERTPEAMLLGREAANVVRRALAAMSEARRSALLLRVDHGLPYADIADVLGWSLSKAKIEVHRARGQLRVLLAERSGDDP
jgi:RNA polymerase sigma-70 factor (ECF subfamily)